MAVVGDRIQMLSRKGDSPPRVGVVTGVAGSLLRIRWSTGDESMVIPGPGALAVIGKVREASSGKKPAASKSAKSAKKTTKK